MFESIDEAEKVGKPFNLSDKGQYLKALAAGIPDGGTLLEVGTGLGISALIFRTGAPRTMRIHTVDVELSPATEAALLSIGVMPRHMESTVLAVLWQEGPPIDFLYVDGGHRLIDVVSDLNAWLPRCVVGGRLVLDDYNPPESVKQPHYAIRVAVNALLASAAVELIETRHSVCVLRVARPFQSLGIESLRRAWHDICPEIRQMPRRSAPVPPAPGVWPPLARLVETQVMLEHGISGLRASEATVEALSQWIAMEQARQNLAYEIQWTRESVELDVPCE